VLAPSRCPGRLAQGDTPRRRLLKAKPAGTPLAPVII